MQRGDVYQWLDPADAVFAAACRESLAIERKAYAAADAERRQLRDHVGETPRAQDPLGREPDVALPGDVIGAVRWTASRKEELLRRLRAGEVGLADAVARYDLTVEEIDGWQDRFRRSGREGLKMTRQEIAAS